MELINVFILTQDFYILLNFNNTKDAITKNWN